MYTPYTFAKRIFLSSSTDGPFSMTKNFILQIHLNIQQKSKLHYLVFLTLFSRAPKCSLSLTTSLSWAKVKSCTLAKPRMWPATSPSWVSRVHSSAIQVCWLLYTHGLYCFLMSGFESSRYFVAFPLFVVLQGSFKISRGVSGISRY